MSSGIGPVEDAPALGEALLEALRHDPGVAAPTQRLLLGLRPAGAGERPPEAGAVGAHPVRHLVQHLGQLSADTVVDLWGWLAPEGTEAAAVYTPASSQDAARLTLVTSTGGVHHAPAGHDDPLLAAVLLRGFGVTVQAPPAQHWFVRAVLADAQAALAHLVDPTAPVPLPALTLQRRLRQLGPAGRERVGGALTSRTVMTIAGRFALDLLADTDPGRVPAAGRDALTAIAAGAGDAATLTAAARAASVVAGLDWATVLAAPAFRPWMSVVPPVPGWETPALLSLAVQHLLPSREELLARLTAPLDPDGARMLTAVVATLERT